MMAIYLIPRLGSHGVVVLASCWSKVFLKGTTFNALHAYTRFAQAVNSGQPQMLKNDWLRFSKASTILQLLAGKSSES